MNLALLSIAALYIYIKKRTVDMLFYSAHDASILLCARRASEITIISYWVFKDITFAITVIINVTEYDAATLVVTKTNDIRYSYIGPQLNAPPPLPPYRPPK